MIIQNCCSKITGVGAYLPKMKVDSTELMREIKASQLGFSDDYVGRITGIEQRRFSTEQESYSFMAIEASKQAINEAGIDPKDIDKVIFCGIESEYAEPAGAHGIASALGCVNAFCHDIRNACLGLINGMADAEAYIGIGAADNILICTGEKPSLATYDAIQKITQANDSDTFRRLLGAFTVGDAGGAFVISRSNDNTGFQLMRLHSYPEHNMLCYAGRANDGSVDFGMDMKKISDVMVSVHKDLADDTYSMLNWTHNDVNKLYCHQVGARPLKSMARISSINMKYVPKTYNLLGNITSATFAVNMHLFPAQKGDKALLYGVGSGLSVCQMGYIF